MRLYEIHALTLAKRALDQLDLPSLKDDITHLIVTTCTGFYAPGLDLQIIKHYGLKPSVERTIIGFMGCYAAINALKLARHIVRSESSARVIVLNLELCTLHLKDTDDLDQMLSFLIFADGCSASLVSAQPSGLELQAFHSTVMPDTFFIQGEDPRFQKQAEYFEQVSQAWDAPEPDIDPHLDCTKPNRR